MFTQYNMTYISKNNMKILLSKDISSREIVRFLQQGAIFRQFRDVLADMVESQNLSRKIKDIMMEDGSKSYETVRKDVRNWLNGIHVPNREDIFHLSFSLQLNLAQTDRLLLTASETGIHYRNPQELIYAYGIKNKLSWKEVNELKDQIIPQYEQAIAPTDHPSQESSELLTKEFEMLYLENVTSEEELTDFILENAHFMGTIHLTVYHDFKDMINLLQKPDGGSRKLSVAEVVEQYLSLPSTGRNYTYLQKLIRKNWPTKDSIYKMLNQSRKVTRKMMILLFLITEEFQNQAHSCLNQDHLDYDSAKEDFDLLFWEEELEEDEILEMRIKLMNMYLNHYSMNPLNPGNPFDCLVLYALKASYMNDESMNEKMREVLFCLFQDV